MKSSHLFFLHLLLVVITITTASTTTATTCPLSHVYSNTSIISVTPTTFAQLSVLQWMLPHPCHIHLLSPEAPTLFVEHSLIISHAFLRDFVVPAFTSSAVTVLAADLGAYISVLPEQQSGYNFAVNVTDGDGVDTKFYTMYHTYDVLLHKMRQVSQRHSNTVKLIKYGKSYEGRDLIALEFTPSILPSTLSSSNDKHQHKCTHWKSVLINALQHAREWATTMSVLYAFESIISTHETHTALSQHCIKLLVVPVSNPDGYEYTRQADRLWRKNRRPGRPCYGVDLNRNWAVNYGGEYSTSTFTCSNEYIGSGAFSEPETLALRSLFLSGDPVVAHADVHSYGQDILAAYQFSARDVRHYKLLDGVAKRLIHVLRHGYKYSRGAEDTVLYKASGFMSDWSFMKGVLGYTIEVSPAADDVSVFNVGFFPDTEYILPIAKDVLQATLVLLQYAQALDTVTTKTQRQSNLNLNLSKIYTAQDDTILQELKRVTTQRDTNVKIEKDDEDGFKRQIEYMMDERSRRNLSAKSRWLVYVGALAVLMVLLMAFYVKTNTTRTEYDAIGAKPRRRGSRRSSLRHESDVQYLLA